VRRLDAILAAEHSKHDRRGEHVAKRTRTSRSTHRPGGQGPSRSKRTSGPESSSEALADAEFSSAEEIGASYSEVEVDEVAAAAVASVTAPQASDDSAAGRRSRRRAQGRTSQKRTRDQLAVRAAAEDAWVREDLRRIGVVSVILVAALAVAYVVFGVVDVLNLY
jgi:hypothetical protein